eukprot:6489057-Alexandrium_andersonii.AAC.1
MQKILRRLREEREFRFVCGLQGRIRPTPERQNFRLKAVKPWIWRSFDEDPPDDEGEGNAERDAWDVALT